jgi:hypothetical protein
MCMMCDGKVAADRDDTGLKCIVPGTVPSVVVLHYCSICAATSMNIPGTDKLRLFDVQILPGLTWSGSILEVLYQ